MHWFLFALGIQRKLRQKESRRAWLRLEQTWMWTTKSLSGYKHLGTQEQDLTWLETRHFLASMASSAKTWELSPCPDQPQSEIMGQASTRGALRSSSRPSTRQLEQLNSSQAGSLTRNFKA